MTHHATFQLSTPFPSEDCASELMKKKRWETESSAPFCCAFSMYCTVCSSRWSESLHFHVSVSLSLTSQNRNSIARHTVRLSRRTRAGVDDIWSIGYGALLWAGEDVFCGMVAAWSHATVWHYNPRPRWAAGWALDAGCYTRVQHTYR